MNILIFPKTFYIYFHDKGIYIYFFLFIERPFRLQKHVVTAGGTSGYVILAPPAAVALLLVTLACACASLPVYNTDCFEVIAGM